MEVTHQFVVVQNNIHLTPEQLLVYVIIKKNMNQKTHLSFINLGDIENLSGLSRPTILKYVEFIKNCGYFKIVKTGANLHYNSYVFPEQHRDEKFEKFAFEMIERDDLTPTEKAYLIALQKYLFIDFESGVGRISMSDLDLYQKIQGSRKKLMEVMKSLKEKGIITAETETFKRDKETGLRVRQREFVLRSYNEAALYRLEKQMANKPDRDEVQHMIDKAIDAKLDQAVMKALKRMVFSNATDVLASEA